MTAILEIPSEIGAGTRGCSLGIGALKTAAHNAGSDFFTRFPCIEIPTENHVLHDMTAHPHAKGIHSILRLYERMNEQIQKSLQSHPFLLMLSGDHSIAGGTISAIKTTYPKKRLGVIWIDAHADIHSPYTTPSGNVHGMPLAVVTGEDNLENKKNDCNMETGILWNDLKMIGGFSPKILPQDIVFCAVRETEPEEDAVIAKHGIPIFSVEEIRKKGAKGVAQNALKLLSDCDLLYVTFDVDSIDPNFSKGTGTPVPNGLTGSEAMELLSVFMKCEKTICLEVTEVNPTLDSDNRMAELTFSILDSLFCRRHLETQSS